MANSKDDSSKEFPMPAIRLTPAPPPPPGTRTWDRIYGTNKKSSHPVKE